jgi:hypothetical protein
MVSLSSCPYDGKVLPCPRLVWQRSRATVGRRGPASGGPAMIVMGTTVRETTGLRVDGTTSVAVVIVKMGNAGSRGEVPPAAGLVPRVVYSGNAHAFRLFRWFAR